MTSHTKPRPRSRSLPSKLGDGSVSVPPSLRRPSATGGTPSTVTPDPSASVVARVVQSQPAAPSSSGRAQPTKFKRAQVDPAVQRLNIRLATIESFLKDDADAPVKRLTAAERDELEQVLTTGKADPAGLAAGFPALDKAVADVATIRQRPIVIPDNLDLDARQTEPMDQDVRADISKRLKDGVQQYGKNDAVKPGLDRVRALIDQGKWYTAYFVLDNVLTAAKAPVVRAPTIAQQQVKRNDPARDRELQAPDLVKNCVARAELGQFDMVRATLRDLRTTNLSDADRDKILASLTDNFFASSKVADNLDNGLDIGADLLGVVADLTRSGAGDVTPDFLEVVGRLLDTRFPVLAKELLSRAWFGSTRFDEASLRIMIEAVPKHEWKADGLSAKVFNMLWRGGQYKLIGELIALGADTNQSAIYGSGSSGRDQEGVWSGFVQPLEHLLGNYLRLASMADDSDEVRPKLAKVKGARQVFEALRTKGKPKVMTDYTAVVKSKALIDFAAKQGTIWGFEDVRLPYVQAAHELPGGKTPLRMWEMWEAVEDILNQSSYTSLMTDPQKTIDKCVAAGVAKIKDKRDKFPEEYFGRRDDEFIARFEEQARSYLTFLSQGSVRAKYATAELSGRGIGKWMGALACKAGLWWAKSKENTPKPEPVYYILDGINLEDVTNYKSLKTAKINAAVDATYPGGKIVPGQTSTPKYHEVITLAEMREILKNWKDLRETVVFIEQGVPVTDLSRVDKWIEDMRASDARTAGTRKGAPATVFEKLLDQIDPFLWGYVDDNEARKIVARAENVRLAADAAHPDVLVATLAESQILIDKSVLPAMFASGFAALLNEKNADERRNNADALEKALEDVSDYMKEPLLRAINRQRTRTT